LKKARRRNVILGLTVVKCGGAAQVRPAAVCAGVAQLVRAGRPVLLVHGGSAAVEDLARGLGVPLRELVASDGTTSRRTDEATLDVLVMALAGRVKPGLLVELAGLGVDAVGLTGLDAGTLTAQRKTALRTVVDGRTMIVRDDRSGVLDRVRTDLLCALLEAGHVPVLSPPALADDGRPVNVNADRVAAAVAVALGAQRLVLLTAAPGVLAEPADPESVRAEYRIPAAGERDPAIRGGMAVKLVAGREALAGGVPQVLIADGRREETVSAALRGVGGTELVSARQPEGVLR
jgi:acetylglutamate/LysW-gamma-L-alpha-aminoadipate kinase